MNFKPVGDKVFPLRPLCTITNFPKPLFIVTSTKSLKTPSYCQVILELNLFGGICKNALSGPAAKAGELVKVARTDTTTITGQNLRNMEAFPYFFISGKTIACQISTRRTLFVSTCRLAAKC